MGAAAPDNNTCQGDMGGPLYVKGVQVGITNWGLGCTDPAKPRIYARLTSYVGWIKRTLINNPK
ncbi:putative Trypsin-7 [Daphnia magna]|uniref:Putative Trypsin-7 n=1 Tax=Daphnia magna TaxID=35525 RepID=A0A164Y0I0_9CRUS|nr:putative Trypsin-7 [Daphnia magna]